MFLKVDILCVCHGDIWLLACPVSREYIALTRSLEELRAPELSGVFMLLIEIIAFRKDSCDLMGNCFILNKTCAFHWVTSCNKVDFTLLCGLICHKSKIWRPDALKRGDLQLGFWSSDLRRLINWTNYSKDICCRNNVPVRLQQSSNYEVFFCYSTA